MWPRSRVRGTAASSRNMIRAGISVSTQMRAPVRAASRLLLLVFALLFVQDQCQTTTQVECGGKSKFLTGFLIAILLGK